MRKKLLALVLVLAVPALAGAAQYGNMTLDSKLESMHKAGVGAVIYPHDKHEALFKCNECHPKLFKEKRGTSNISMKMNMDGKFCGSANCHNSPAAFPLYMCTNCHTNVGAKK
ncbi:MAG: hypothetical protein HYV23_08240 [Deltaproteobacteria bacterium]|nr:hypothetical protein [Deltaproteobacteria bacterium]